MKPHRSFGTWILAAACAVLMTLAGCDNASRDAASPDSETSATQAGASALGATRINAAPAHSPAPSALPTSATAGRAAMGVPGKNVFTGKVTTADGSSTDTTFSVVLTAMDDPFDGRFQSKSTTATVAVNGTYRFEIEPSSRVVLRVLGDGFVPMSTPIGPDLISKSTTHIFVRDFALLRGAEISGRVVDNADTPLTATLSVGWPMLGAGSQPENPVYNQPETRGFSTPKDGFKLFSAAGEVLVTASAPGFAPITKVVTAPASDLELRLGEGATVEGVVRHLVTREPVSSATVHLNQPDDETQVPGRSWQAKESETVTDTSGAFRFVGLLNDTYRIYAQAENLAEWTRPPATSSLTISDGASTSGVELLVHPGYTVSGRVTDSKTGEPIEGVAIAKSNHLNPDTMTDANGQYRLSNVFFSGWATARKEGYRMDDAASARSAPVRSDTQGAYALDLLLGDELHVTRDFKMAPSPGPANTQEQRPHP